MATLRGSGSRHGATSIVRSVAACIATTGAMVAQAAHPFAPPAHADAFTLSAAVGVVDVNRDAGIDFIVPGIFAGTLVMTLDENGGTLAGNFPGPDPSAPPGAQTWPRVLAMAGADFDGDTLEDLVTVSAAGAAHFHRNLGATQIAGNQFAPDVLVDDFQAGFPISPPFVNYWFPVALAADVDLDGHVDALVAGGPDDAWGGATTPGFVAVYRGDGAGGFQVIRHTLAGGVVDAEFADLDNDGVGDCVVVLVETGAAGAFGYEIVHLQWQNGALVPLGFPQSVGPSRPVALEIADVMGDANGDYVVAQVAVVGGTLQGQVYCFAGDGQGNLNSSAWGTIALPSNLTGVSDFVCSIQVGDFDHDSHPDLAVLRGYVQPSAAAPVFADAEVLVAMGPGLLTAPLEVLPLTGYFNWSSVSTNLFAMRPLRAEPDRLAVIDLGRDGSCDFVVSGMREVANPSAPRLAVLRNQTGPLPGAARFEKVGEPSGGLPWRPARIGFEGGRPEPGNGAFACTIQNVRGGCLVGLMWGSYAIPNLFSMFGFDFHFAPEQFGYGAIASGSGAADGFFSYALPIPPVPAIVGNVGYFQYNYYDHVAGVFGGTQATGVWVGN